MSDNTTNAASNPLPPLPRDHLDQPERCTTGAELATEQKKGFKAVIEGKNTGLVSSEGITKDDLGKSEASEIIETLESREQDVTRKDDKEEEEEQEKETVGEAKTGEKRKAPSITAITRSKDVEELDFSFEDAGGMVVTDSKQTSLGGVSFKNVGAEAKEDKADGGRESKKPRIDESTSDPHKPNDDISSSSIASSDFVSLREVYAPTGHYHRELAQLLGRDGFVALRHLTRPVTRPLSEDEVRNSYVAIFRDMCYPRTWASQVRFFMELPISSFAKSNPKDFQSRLDNHVASILPGSYIPERADLVIGIDTEVGCIPILPVELKNRNPDAAALRKLIVQAVHTLFVANVSFGTPAAFMIAGARFSRLFVVPGNVITIELGLFDSTVRSVRDLMTYRSWNDSLLPHSLQFVKTDSDSLLNAQRFVLHAANAFKAARISYDSNDRSVSPFQAGPPASDTSTGAVFLRYSADAEDRGQIYGLHTKKQTPSESGSGATRRVVTPTGPMQPPSSIRRPPSDDGSPGAWRGLTGASARKPSVVQRASASGQQTSGTAGSTSGMQDAQDASDGQSDSSGDTTIGSTVLEIIDSLDVKLGSSAHISLREVDPVASNSDYESIYPSFDAEPTDNDGSEYDLSGSEMTSSFQSEDSELFEDGWESLCQVLKNNGYTLCIVTPACADIISGLAKTGDN
ncbi:hypothetical protein IAT40_001274 [Kwoniella sp. CBS 6097]